MGDRLVAESPHEVGVARRDLRDLRDDDDPPRLRRPVVRHLRTGAGRADGVVGVGEALREVVDEELRELARLAVVLLRVRPRRARVEQRASTPGTATGTRNPNSSSVRSSTSSSSPSSAARSIARVAAIGIRLPCPNGPPVQPVFTSQTAEPCASSFSPSMRAYTAGGCGRKGWPKQVENVGCGSVTPISVPASFAVKPERK